MRKNGREACYDFSRRRGFSPDRFPASRQRMAGGFFMFGRALLRLVPLFALTFVISAPVARAQSVFHRIEGRVQFRGTVNDVLVRLYQQGGMVLVEEAFSRGEGQFSFNRIPEGDYVIETLSTDKYAPSSTQVSVRPLDRRRSQVFIVYVQLQLKPEPATTKPGVITADVDVNVPKDAQKHYREGMKALGNNAAERGVAELQTAIKLYPNYYAARLELGRELRLQKQFAQAAETLKPLLQIAPKRDEPRVEYGIVLMALEQLDEAVTVLREALALSETNWVPHLYLGMALVDKDAAEAEKQLRRAIELNELKAARAYLSLARLAAARGERQLSIERLQTYLKLVPDSPDAANVQKLIERLRANK
jgi:tetratricopeptide (TPR) repeat protein